MWRIQQYGSELVYQSFWYGDNQPSGLYTAPVDRVCAADSDNYSTQPGGRDESASATVTLMPASLGEHYADQRALSTRDRRSSSRPLW